jgi:hypothetical protein
MAGYLDADGCVRWSGTARVEITSVFPWSLWRFRRHFGGRVAKRRPKPNSTRPVYRWSLSGDQARACLRTLREFMHEKRIQADLVLRICETPPGPARQGMVAQLGALKHAHYKTATDNQQE